ncbi:hypothetical protein [Streptomyces griseofuscus]|uniref:hypothetical protein n=1 Tax=Streptomyces griseofuscus TaxID=146922 RepID=UPI0033D31398
MTPITCALCIEPYYAVPAGEFTCPCGQVLTGADIELETAQVWVVGPSGALGYVLDPKARLIADAAQYGLVVRLEDVPEDAAAVDVEAWVEAAAGR